MALVFELPQELLQGRVQMNSRCPASSLVRALLALLFVSSYLLRTLLYGLALCFPGVAALAAFILLDRWCGQYQSVGALLGFAASILALIVLGLTADGFRRVGWRWGAKWRWSARWIKRVDLSGRRINSGIFGDLTKLPRIRALDLSGTDVTDSGVNVITDLTTLRELNLGQTQISDMALTNFRHLRDLHELHLERCPITDHGLRHLADLSQLMVLCLDGCKLGDSAVEHLIHLPALAELTIADTHISDTGLAALSHHRSLSLLTVSGTNVTNQGIESFRTLRHDVVILGTPQR